MDGGGAVKFIFAAKNIVNISGQTFCDLQKVTVIIYYIEVWPFVGLKETIIGNVQIR